MCAFSSQCCGCKMACNNHRLHAVLSDSENISALAALLAPRAYTVTSKTTWLGRTRGSCKSKWSADAE
jgi:hypothetical protein